MNKIMIVSGALVAALSAFAAAPTVKVVKKPLSPRPVQHVPATAETIRVLKSDAKDRNHILVVNVAGAVPKDMWGVCVPYAAERVQLNITTNDLDKSMKTELVANNRALQRRFGEKATVGVFIENDPAAPAMMTVPLEWCIVNVAGLDRGTTDRQTVRDRFAKAILRGIAVASGAGLSLERNCSMHIKGNTPEGLDSIDIALTPMTYFPMVEALQAKGGSELVSYEARPKGKDED